MKSPIILVIVIFICLLGCSNNSLALDKDVKAKSIKVAEQAFKYLQQKKYDEAISAYLKAISLHPEEQSYYLGCGMAYQSIGELKKAIQCYEKALKMAPKERVILKVMESARIELANRLYDRAYKKHMEELKSEHPDLATVVELYKESLKKYDLLKTHFYLACAFQSQGKLDKSIEEYSICIKRKPKFADPYYHRGIVYETMKKQVESERDFENYLKCATVGKYSREVKNKLKEIDLKTTGELEHNDPIKYYEQAMKIVREYGDMPEAIELLSKSIKLDPNRAKTYYGRGIAFGEMGLFSLAVKDYTRAIELDPKFEPVYYNRGYCNYSMGQFQVAIDDLTKAIQLNPKNADAYGIRSFAYDKIGKKKESLKDQQMSDKLTKDK